uniref:Secreted peptide n=1 Tax=Anopheles braziliensis TaxID=58242 RepID=A0A2M3ZLH5_9DIPT
MLLLLLLLLRLLLVLPVAFLFLLQQLLGITDDSTAAIVATTGTDQGPTEQAGRRRYDPIEILLQVAPATLAAAHLVHQIVTLLRPQVLLPLLVRPGAGTSDRLQVAQDAFLPLLEALAVHVLAGGAAIVATQHPHAITQILQIDHRPIIAERLQALAGRNATATHVGTFRARSVRRMRRFEAVVRVEATEKIQPRHA